MECDLCSFRYAADILQTLNEALVATLADDSVMARLLELGIEARSGSPAALAERLRSDIAKWSNVITTAGISRQ